MKNPATCFWLAVCLLLTTYSAHAAEKPNILFLFTDDQRADTIHALGNDAIITPHLDSLVERGMAFTNAHCFGSDRAGVCAPSRNMLLSGRTYFRYSGVLAPADKPNFPTSMNEAGYETWHHGKEGNTAKLIHTKFHISKYVEFRKHHRQNNGEPCGFIVDQAIDFLESRKGDKPFFMYMAPSEPHEPRVPGAKYLAMYQRDQIPIPENFLPVHPFDNGDIAAPDEWRQLPEWPRPTEEVRKHLHDYYAFITGMDANFGRLFQALKDLGQFDNTIIIFASDNGLALGSHGLMGKQSVYEHSAKVPLVIAGPGIPKGTSPSLVYLMDIFPTVCDLVGQPVPDGLDGRSLKPILAGQTDNVRDTLLSVYKDCQRAVQDERWKLIRYPKINKTQLFDLQRDPHETNNLAESPEYAAQVDRMMHKLRQTQQTYGDTLPLTSSDPLPQDITVEQIKARIKGNPRKH